MNLKERSQELIKGIKDRVIPTGEKKEKKKKNKVWTIVRIAIPVIAVLLLFVIEPQDLISWMMDEGKVTYETATVTRGDISQTVECSGALEANEKYDINALVSGRVVVDNVVEGQQVKQGDLLYQIDDTDIQNSVKQAEASLEKAKASYNESVKEKNNLSVKANVSGVVKSISAKKGNTISTGETIAEIINDKTMLLKINFRTIDIQNIHIGSVANVNVPGVSSNIVGKVAHVSSGSITNSYGVPVTTVEITVNNPGGIKAGDSATATIGEYACNAAGKFEYSENCIVLSNVNGTVENVYVKTGDYVSSGSVLIKVTNNSIDTTLQHNKLGVNDAQINLDNYKSQLEKYKVYSPIDGTIIKKNIKFGENYDMTMTGIMVTVSDVSKLVYFADVDESDISKLSVGQKLTIKADALSDLTFEGSIESIGLEGNTNNGVTSYPVKIVIEESLDDLSIGLNVTGNAIIGSKENVLLIPKAAIQKGNKVKILTNEKKGIIEERVIVTGLNDGTYVEVKSGLNEGEKVIMPETSSSSGTGSSALDQLMQ